MKIAIQGHLARGKEVIQILESLGGKNSKNWHGCGEIRDGFFIDNDGTIRFDDLPKGYKLYTLEEFEEEFPFKVGDKIITPLGHIGTITNIEDNKYEVFFKIDSALISPKRLKLYKEMKEERNITLTLDKAKEWYKKGGELKEVALQAYSEEELTKVELPKSWEEFCKNYPVKKDECWIGSQDAIYSATMTQDRKYKNWITSKKSAEAHLALIQLEQLRDCWRQGWEPDSNSSYCIKKHKTFGLGVYEYCTSEFLSFKNRKTAEEFLKCFKDLIEKAGDLI